MSEASAEEDTAEAGAGLVPVREPRRSRADKQAFARRLGQLIHGRGIRQADLARMANLKPSDISTYMLGKALPGKTNLHAIARALDVEPMNLLPAAVAENDTVLDTSPMALAVDPRNPAVANLRINMKVRTELGAEIIRMLIKSQEAGQAG